MKKGVPTYIDGEQPAEALKVPVPHCYSTTLLFLLSNIPVRHILCIRGSRSLDFLDLRSLTTEFGLAKEF
jgi:hypothetical protein